MYNVHLYTPCYLSFSIYRDLPPPPPHTHRLIGFGMVWLYRKNKYTVMDIQGLSVDEWGERQRTSKTRAVHSRTNSVTASVHYSSTGDSVVIGMDNSNQK